jgi:hypothetical protein
MGEGGRLGCDKKSVYLCMSGSGCWLLQVEEVSRKFEVQCGGAQGNPIAFQDFNIS